MSHSDSTVVRSRYSFTSRHLAEFWMIEPEIAFAGLAEDMDLAEVRVRARGRIWTWPRL